MLTLLASAGAIVGRDDLPADAYVVPDADWPALVDLIEPGDCIGTLIEPSFLLTVAHCAVDVREGRTFDVAGVQVVASAVFVHPDWRDRDVHDVALVRLEAPITHVEPVPLGDAQVTVGDVVGIVGRGISATGLEGEDGGVTDGRLRRATNVVTAVGDASFAVLFDPPGPTATDLEGVGAAGDSGGPVFREGTLVGLNSFGDDEGGGVATYGSHDHQVHLATYAPWIRDVLAGRVEPSRPRRGCAHGVPWSGLGLLARR